MGAKAGFKRSTLSMRIRYANPWPIRLIVNRSETQARSALQRAVAGFPADIGAALADVGWQQVVGADEGLAFTVLFEELGYAGACTDAIDVAITSSLAGGHGALPVVWPLHTGNSAEDIGGSGQLFAEGVLLNPQRTGARRVLAACGDRMYLLVLSALDESIPDYPACDVGWVRVHVWGTPIAELSSWRYIKRRGLLAIASELVGLANRIVDLAATPSRHRQGHLCPSLDSSMPATQTSVVDRTEIARAKALISAAWEDGSTDTAMRAKAAAAAAHDRAASRAIDVWPTHCGIDEDPLAALIRRGLALQALMARPRTSPTTPESSCDASLR